MVRSAMIRLPPDGVLLADLAEDHPEADLDMAFLAIHPDKIEVGVRVSGIDVPKAVRLSRDLASALETFHDRGYDGTYWRFDATIPMTWVHHPLWKGLLRFTAYQDRCLLRVHKGLTLYTDLRDDANPFFFEPDLQAMGRSMGVDLRLERPDLNPTELASLFRDLEGRSIPLARPGDHRR